MSCGLFRDDRVFAVYGMATPGVVAGLEGAHALPVRDVEFVFELPQAVVLHHIRATRSRAQARRAYLHPLSTSAALPFTGGGEPDDRAR